MVGKTYLGLLLLLFGAVLAEGKFQNHILSEIVAFCNVSRIIFLELFKKSAQTFDLLK